MSEKQCLICKDLFETIKFGDSRKFCFNCSPYYPKGNNVGRGQTITALRQAIKRELVKYKGYKCEICGYDKCIQSLQFHHIDPSKKEFTISCQLALGNFKIENYYLEVDKCILVCSNCHGEIHANDI